MCGIVGYIGGQNAYPIIINGLKRLEYRGYDSAGIALYNGKSTSVYKKYGKVSDLENSVAGLDTSGCLGIGHTRWATHGEPNDKNAHPHMSMHGKFVIVHNGIIENYSNLKKRLTTRGYTFKSETDSEVLADLIEYIYELSPISPDDAVQLALRKVQGAYGIVVMCTDTPTASLPHARVVRSLSASATRNISLVPTHRRLSNIPTRLFISTTTR